MSRGPRLCRKILAATALQATYVLLSAEPSFFHPGVASPAATEEARRPIEYLQASKTHKDVYARRRGKKIESPA